LREQPVTVGTPPRTFTYAALVSTMIGNLNRVPRWTPAAELLQTLWTSCEPGASLPAPDAAVSPPAQEIEVRPEQQYAVLCAESPNPRPPGVFRALAALADARAGDVGPFWAWQDEPCASWPATAAARSAGPWDRPTAHPILVINTTYDPATPYEGAVALATALARARLLTVDGYGHSLGGVPSACVSDAISRYVVDGTLPPEGTVCPQDQPPFTTSSGSTLPRNVVVPLSVVNEFFPDVTQEASTGQNATAVGNPTATRSVIYATSDGSKKVTITVDQYGSASDASSAYQEAVQKSEEVPGFTPLPPPIVGQQAFAGIVTMGAETHVGLGALDGTLIVGATLAGYDATPDNIAQLVALARTEDAAAKMALGISYGAPNR
jgi:hypothetical protein